jgi:Secretion system C-terminal sorting domain/Right handed beta helix region
MKIVFSFSFLLALLISAHAQTNIPAGYVSGHWDINGSPYQINGNIVLHQDSNLMLDAGVSVLFMENYRFTIYGTMQAGGKADSLVIFDTGNTFYRWDGIEFRDTINSPADSSILQYCNFSSSTHYYGGAIGIFGYNRLRIDHCEFEYNHAFKGGALYLINANPLLLSLLVENNSSVDGGGIFLINSSPLIRNTIVQENISDWMAGGIFAKDSSSPIIENSSILRNSSLGSGGGLYFHDYCEPIIRNCIISGNVCEGTMIGTGGGLKVNFHCKVRLENCEISNNQSYSRGGGLTATADVDLVSCLLSGNQTVQGGGGLMVDLSLLYYRPNINIINSTFTNNNCQNGAAINSMRSDLNLTNTIVWGNENSGDSDIVIDKTALFIDFSNIEDTAGIIVKDSSSLIIGSATLEQNPVFQGLNDFHFVSTSPCINTGSPDTIGLNLPLKDLDGFMRIFENRIDMGCYEFQEPIAIDEQITEEYLLYPNPAHEKFSIRFNKTRNTQFSIEIFDALGNLKTKTSFRGGASELTIACKNWYPGMYYLRITNPERNLVYAEKLIVN